MKGKIVSGLTKTGNLSKAMQLADLVKASSQAYELVLSPIAGAQIEMGGGVVEGIPGYHKPSLPQARPVL